jgi:hypothetical protein
MKLRRWICRLSHHKWWKRCSLRLNRLPHPKTFLSQSLRPRRKFNRSLLKKEHRRRSNHKRRRHSRRSRARARCRCREQRRSRYTRRDRSTRTKLDHGTSPGVGPSSAQWTQAAAASVAVVFRRAPGVLFWIMPPLARFENGDLDRGQFRRLTFPLPSP